MFDFSDLQAGNLVVVAVTLAVVVFFIINLRRIKSLSVKALTFSALFISLSTILSYVKLFSMPQGGTVTACSMLFISLIGYFFGLEAGILAGVTHGLVQLVLDPHVVHPAQLLLDYILAFGFIGLSGLFRSKSFGLETGIILGMLARFVMSSLSGYVFFGQYAPDGQSPAVYSIVYNITYIAPEILLTLIVVSIPPIKRLIMSTKKSLGSNNVVVN